MSSSCSFKESVDADAANNQYDHSHEGRPNDDRQKPLGYVRSVC